MILAAELCWASKILPLGPRRLNCGLGPRGRILLTQPFSAARIVTNPNNGEPNPGVKIFFTLIFTCISWWELKQQPHQWIFSFHLFLDWGSPRRWVLPAYRQRLFWCSCIKPFVRHTYFKIDLPEGVTVAALPLPIKTFPSTRQYCLGHQGLFQDATKFITGYILSCQKRHLSWPPYLLDQDLADQSY